MSTTLDPSTLSNFKRTSRWLAACGKLPSEGNLSVQIGCHIEEFSEFLSTLNIESATGVTSEAMQEVTGVLCALGHNIKRGYAVARIYDRESALDALSDLDVTGNGVAYLAHFQKDRADERVLAANDDKLNADGTAVILEGGKIGKRDGWVAPDLSDLV